MPLVLPPPAPVADAGPFVVPKAEVRTELFGQDLERLGASEDPGSLGFQVSRSRVGFSVTLAERAKAVLVFAARNNTGTGIAVAESTGEEISYDQYPADWDFHVPFAYVEGTTTLLGLDHTLRFGVQKPLFGFRPKYDWYTGGFYMPHPVAFRDLGRRSKVVPSFDMGLAWTVKRESVSMDVQVMNGTGWRAYEQNLGKDVLVRVSAQPIDLVKAVGTLVYSPESDGSTTMTWQAGVKLTREPVRVLVEAIGGTHRADSGSTGHLGGAVAVSGDLSPAALAVVDRISPMAGVQVFDGDTTVEGDAWMSLQGGAAAFFEVNPKLTSWVGLGWETLATPAGSEPPSHSAALTVGWRY